MSEDTKTAAPEGAFTRSGTYSFPENGKPSPNYLRRVKPVGGNFVQGVNEVVPILEGDILMKLPGKTPWFAQYRDVQEASAEESTETKAEESTEVKTEGDAPDAGSPAETKVEAPAETKPEAPKAEGSPAPAKGKGK